MTTFGKQPIDVQQQIDNMIARGLVVPDRLRAENHLRTIGYYRFSGYALHFQFQSQYAKTRYFYRKVSIEEITDRYYFDKVLRIIILDSVERIEIALRAMISDCLALKYGSHWYLDRSVFEPSFNFADYVADVQRQIGHNPIYFRNRAAFIKHYYDTYTNPAMPPCWMIFEAVSFGTISKIFGAVKQTEVQSVCNTLALPYHVIKSWLHSISYLRNLCAHHSRVWNRTITIKPIIANKHRYFLKDNSKVYAQLVILQYLDSHVATNSAWRLRLFNLLLNNEEYLSEMGFPPNWRDAAIWR